MPLIVGTLLFGLIAVAASIPASAAGVALEAADDQEYRWPTGDVVLIGEPGCGDKPADGGRLKFTIYNNSGSNRVYDLAVGPQRHDNLWVGAGRWHTFVLKGIPDGTHKAEVRLDRGPTLASKADLTFSCQARRCTSPPTRHYVGYPVRDTYHPFACSLTSSVGNFVIHYNEGRDAGSITLAQANMIASILEEERLSFAARSFGAPLPQVPVYVWPRTDGDIGFSPPGRIELKSQSPEITDRELLRRQLLQQFRWALSGR